MRAPSTHVPNPPPPPAPPLIRGERNSAVPLIRGIEGVVLQRRGTGKVNLSMGNFVFITNPSGQLLTTYLPLTPALSLVGEREDEKRRGNWKVGIQLSTIN